MNLTDKNRRTFLQQSAALSTAAAATGVFGMPELYANQPALPEDEKLGVALVGLGSLSTNQIAPALQKTKRCKLAAIVSGTPAKQEKWAKQYDLAPEHIYDYESLSLIHI